MPGRRLIAVLVTGNAAIGLRNESGEGCHRFTSQKQQQQQ